MDGNHDRSWMYNRLTERRELTQVFLVGLQEFINFATAHSTNSSREIRCPCVKCRCIRFEDFEEVKIHLCKRGFMKDYECWEYHGEVRQTPTPSGYYGDSSHRDNLNLYEQLVMDAAGPSIGRYFDPVTHAESSYMGEETDTHAQPSYMGEDPHPEADRFYKMLREAQRPLWEGCEHFENSEYSSLSATLATLSLKTDHHMSERNYNEMMP
ncbi:hypothetical protein QN277_019043 [Acacia crassicarpa]|uniref:Transposase-associated domain-containing protein n=1 Tax=Acacia crassicarpa TaxID=499986 RepID=A0AAE1JT11_9FABA|nr:hypothetical protein QN277_019043 [Acacia crassicarpa]